MIPIKWVENHRPRRVESRWFWRRSVRQPSFRTPRTDTDGGVKEGKSIWKSHRRLLFFFEMWWNLDRSVRNMDIKLGYLEMWSNLDMLEIYHRPETGLEQTMPPSGDLPFMGWHQMMVFTVMRWGKKKPLAGQGVLPRPPNLENCPKMKLSSLQATNVNVIELDTGKPGHSMPFF